MEATKNEIGNKFEKTTCGRCAGSGKHSFNLRDGDVCYGCLGSGKKLTVRGKLAKEFYERSLCKLASELIAGDAIKLQKSDADNAFRLIGSVKANGADIEMELESRGTLPPMKWGSPAGAVIRIAHSLESKQAKFAAAMEYQASLTLAGKPRRR